MAGAPAPCQEKQYPAKRRYVPCRTHAVGVLLRSNGVGKACFRRTRLGLREQGLAREKTPMTMLSRRTLLAITLPAIAAGTARAEDAEDYPTRQVMFIVPFAPAGGTDILARLLGQKLEQRLNKSFVVENRPGAGTVIATNF